MRSGENGWVAVRGVSVSADDGFWSRSGWERGSERFGNAGARDQQMLVPGDRSVQWRDPVEAVVAVRLVDLGPPRQRALFGLLLSQVDRPVAVDTVIADLWAGDPPAR